MSSSFSSPYEEESYEVQRRDILSSRSTNYMVLNSNGEGSFGKVVKCVDLTTKKLVAVKIHKKDNHAQNQREVQILNAVRALDPEKNNIVRFMDSFTSNNLSCLAFEMLDKSLADLMSERNNMPLSHREIRPVLFQLLVAFKALKSIGIVHTDMKPDNVMLVNQKHQPFRIKIIDFGLAIPVKKLMVGKTIQAASYRAPEVILGLPLSEAVDMWGLGCILMYLHFGIHFFEVTCSFHRMKAMVHMLGQPDDNLLSAGQNTWKFFSKKKGSVTPRWRLRQPYEYTEASGIEPHCFKTAMDLEDAVMSYPEIEDPLEFLDKMAFFSLLKACLHMDAGRRITPEKALKHTFITMVHLVNLVDTSSYAKDALKLMTVSSLDETDNYTTDPDLELTDDQASSDGGSGTIHSTAVKTFSKSELSFASLGEKDSDTVCSIALKTFSKSDPTSASFSEKDSDNSRLSGNKADVESFCGEDLETESSSSDEGIDHSALRSFDRKTFTLCSNDHFSSFHFDESGSMDGHSNAEISNHLYVAGPSAAATSCDRAPFAINGDRAGSTDGAAPAITTKDVVDVKTKKKRNLLQKTCKFFSQVKKRVFSLFKPRPPTTNRP